MRSDDFDYNLPLELIAQRPAARPTDARLLHARREDQGIFDRRIRDLIEILRPGDLLVFNDTRVVPARLLAVKETGGGIEIMTERLLDEHSLLAQIRASKSPKPGMRLMVQPSQTPLTVRGRKGELYELYCGDPVQALLERDGHVPLPPYIDRQDDATDAQRYQTVFAKYPGAVAAPTAGLHFNQDILKDLSDRGIQQTFITLHVGMGTFAPVRCTRLEDHIMHTERMRVSGESLRRIARARREGRRIVAVGTTSVRCLESLPDPLPVRSRFYEAETAIFIYPGYRFRWVDAMITNFHLPKSTLLMLVCAFAGKPFVNTAYGHAIASAYRFYSYGDAMFIE